MSSQPQPSLAAREDAPCGVPDAVRTEQQLAVLDELMHAGRRLALAIEAQGTARSAPSDAEPAPRVVEGDVGLAFDRVSRAVRLTVALQARLIADRRAWEESLVHDERMFRTARASEREDRAEARKDRVERIIRRVADGAWPEADDDAGEGEREDRIERLLDKARERLDEDDVYDVLAHPVSDTIAYICRLLGLAPDWPGLAEEAWAREEIATGPVGAPLAALSSPPAGNAKRRRVAAEGDRDPSAVALAKVEAVAGALRNPGALGKERLGPNAPSVILSSA